MKQQLHLLAAKFNVKGAMMLALLSMLVMAAGAPASGGGFGWP